MTDAMYAPRKAQLDADIKHNREIILQSNNRASGIAQLLAAIVTLIGVMGAVSLSLDTKTTPATYLLGGIAAAGLLVSVGGLLSVLWPRLRGMARDNDVHAYKSRLLNMADSDLTIETLDFSQAFRLQKIAFIKERSTQVAVAGMLVMCGAAVAMFAILL